jgi:hypothetical protein
MNESDFEAQLRADGYTEIETQNLDPRPVKGRHRHLFAIRASSCPAHLTSRRMASRSHLVRGKSLPSPTENCTTNLSEQRVHAC